MPKRPRLGQHFLHDEAILHRIAEAAVEPGEGVVEIGPGKGALTRHLLDRAARVSAVEIDSALAAELAERCGNPDHLDVLEEDVLQFELPLIPSQHASMQWFVTGNLPYYITSPILRSVFAAHRFFRSVTVLVQAEVAARIAARKGERDYGFLSCLCQLYGRPRRLFTVPPAAFHPAPRVQSALVQIALNPEPPEEGLEAFLEACYRSPRKTLRNNLAHIYPRSALSDDPAGSLRAQQLDIDAVASMHRRLNSGR